MSDLNQQVTYIMNQAAAQVLQAVQQESGEPWQPVMDADGNENLPGDERTVLVFLCGDCERDNRPADAGYGLRMGYFEQDRRRWRAGGCIERYVTHWMEVPPTPKLTEDV